MDNNYIADLDWTSDFDRFVRTGDIPLADELARQLAERVDSEFEDLREDETDKLDWWQVLCNARDDEFPDPVSDFTGGPDGIDAATVQDLFEIIRRNPRIQTIHFDGQIRDQFDQPSHSWVEVSVRVRSAPVEDRVFQLEQNFYKAAAFTQARQEHVLLGVKPYTNHPEDTFLVVVLYRNERGQFVTHTFNGEIPSLNLGHYHDNLTDALRDFNERGNVHDQDGNVF